MLKRDITYEDYNGNVVTEAFYFNLTRMELFDLEVDKNGLEGWLKEVLSKEDNKAIFEEFKKLILVSYGEKTEDGKRFIKSDESREAFKQSPAFDELAFELMSNPETFEAFIRGALSSAVNKELSAAEKKNAVDVAPVPPSPPAPPAA